MSTRFSLPLPPCHSFYSIICFIIWSRGALLHRKRMYFACCAWLYGSTFQSTERHLFLFLLLALISCCSQIVSHVSLPPRGSLDPDLPLSFFAVCMASVPEATNPLRYSLLAALPRPVEPCLSLISSTDPSPPYFVCACRLVFVPTLLSVVHCGFTGPEM